MVALPFETSRSGLKTLKSGGIGSRAQLSSPTTAQLTGAYMSSLTSSPHLTSKTTSEIQRPISSANKSDIKSNTSVHVSSSHPWTDYTIKRQIVVTSAHSFGWIGQKSSLWAITPQNALVSVPNATVPYQDRFFASLFYYRYPDLLHTPSSDPTRAKVDLTPADQSETWSLPSAFVAQSRLHWTHALQNSAELVLSQPGNSFVVCHQEWNFGCSSAHATPVAYFNKTSLFLRKLLVQNGVSFFHPLLEVAGDGEEARAAVSSDSISCSATIDDTPSSLVVFENSENIRQLIQFLVKSCVDSEKWLGLCPPILSSKPFLHGSLQRLIQIGRAHV